MGEGDPFCCEGCTLRPRGWGPFLSGVTPLLGEALVVGGRGGGGANLQAVEDEAGTAALARVGLADRPLGMMVTVRCLVRYGGVLLGF